MQVKSANKTPETEKANPAKDKDAARQFLLEADKFLKESKFDLARTQLEKAKELDPSNPYIYAFQDRISYFEEQRKKEAAAKPPAAPKPQPPVVKEPPKQATAPAPPVAEVKPFVPNVPPPAPKMQVSQPEIKKAPEPNEEQRKKQLELQAMEELKKKEAERLTIEEQIRKELLARSYAEDQRRKELEDLISASDLRRKESELRMIEEQRRRDLEARAAVEERLRRELELRIASEEQKRKDLEERIATEERKRKEMEAREVEERQRKELEARALAEEQKRKELEARIATEERRRKELEERIALDERRRREEDLRREENQRLRDIEERAASEERRRRELETKIAAEEQRRKELEAQTAQAHKQAQVSIPQEAPKKETTPPVVHSEAAGQGSEERKKVDEMRHQIEELTKALDQEKKAREEISKHSLQKAVKQLRSSLEAAWVNGSPVEKASESLHDLAVSLSIPPEAEQSIIREVKLDMYSRAVKEVIAKRKLLRNSSSTLEWLRKVYQVSVTEYLENESKFLLDLVADQYKGTILFISKTIGTKEDISPKLKASGYAVVPAVTPENALEKIEKINPNVILCDTHFPEGGLSGVRFLHVLRANSKFNFIPFILISEMDEMTELNSSELKPNEGCIKRPMEYEELTNLMNEKLAHFREYISSLG